jgi:hypothetical protein
MESHSSAATELDIFHADALSGGTELGAYAASVAIELQIVVLSCCPRARSTSSLREGALRGFCEELRDDRWYRCPACRPDLSRFQANKRLAVVNLLLATAQTFARITGAYPSKQPSIRTPKYSLDKGYQRPINGNTDSASSARISSSLDILAAGVSSLTENSRRSGSLRVFKNMVITGGVIAGISTPD